MKTAAQEVSDPIAGREASAGAGLSAQATDRRRELEGLLARDLPQLQRMAMRWLRNREDAEDAVQDALMAAFVHIASFEGRSRMSSWLMSIVINSVKMHLRRSRRKLIPLDPILEDGSRTLAELVTDSRPNPEQACGQTELSEILAKCISKLSSSQRIALQLFNRGDCSIKEIAEILGLAEGTVKAQLSRGRSQLAQRLRKLLREPDTHLSEAKVRGPKYRRRPPGTEQFVPPVASPISSGESAMKAKSFDEPARRPTVVTEMYLGVLEVAVEGSPVPA